jgi:predicted AlkP superfamily pyrophosphatase or phosphodiesterase
MKTLELIFFIVLGLYAEDHGMVGNYMYDEHRDEYFNMMENEECKHSHWWEGAEPFWITTVKQVHVVFTFSEYYTYIVFYFIQEEFEDTKGAIRIRKSKRTDNKMAKRKRTHDDLQNIHIKLNGGQFPLH